MKKSAVQKFAVEARKFLPAVLAKRAAFLGSLAEKGGVYCSILGEKIEKNGFQAVVKESSQICFNRIIAVRFMEVNGFFPENGSFHSERDYLKQILTETSELQPIFPALFSQNDRWAEILFTGELFSEGGIIERLLAVPESDWKNRPQILGWLYQYYNTESKPASISKKAKKVEPEEFSDATQIFTPDWIVQYLVENSLGRLWIDGHPGSGLKDKWDYFFNDLKNTPFIETALDKIRRSRSSLSPFQIKLIDPCVGCGNILLYAFDLLIQLYEESGFSPQQAADEILTRNLFGLDIDERSVIMTQFALLMKAREYDPLIFSKGIRPNVLAFAKLKNRPDSENIFTVVSQKKPEVADSLVSLWNTFQDADVFGSLTVLPDIDFQTLRQAVEEITWEETDGSQNFSEQIQYIFTLTEILSQKYDVVVTNPPYLGIRNMNKKLYDFILKYYRDYKYDTFSAFIMRCCSMALPSGYVGMFTPYAWMFIQSYEKTRKYLCSTVGIKTLIQLEFCAFGDASVPLCSFVIQNSPIPIKGSYLRLSDFRGGMEVQRCKAVEARRNHHCGYYFEASTSDFQNLPGTRFAFWLSPNLRQAFNMGVPLSLAGETRQGMTTCNNKRFLRRWYEVNLQDIAFGCRHSQDALKTGKKWFPFNKGGGGRKWYGNRDYVVNYAEDGREVKEYTAALHGNSSRTVKSTDCYFRESLSWSKISGEKTGFRYYEDGFVFSDAGCAVFYNDREKMFYDFGFLNSKAAEKMLAVISPTVNSETGHIAALPVIDRKDLYPEVGRLTAENIALSRADWDSFESSWDFSIHPFLRFGLSSLSEAFELWREETEKRFSQLRANEIRLNEIFLGLYRIQDEVNSEISNEEISVRRAERGRDVRSLISFAVGSIFGRFSQNEREEPAGKTVILDSEIDLLFEDWIREQFGEKKLEENLSFIADSLKVKGNSPREVIHHYFQRGFYLDHLKIYHKIPIYWLFVSGEKKGFQALVYYPRLTQETFVQIASYVSIRRKEFESDLVRLRNDIQQSGSQNPAVLVQMGEITSQIREFVLFEEKIARIIEQNLLWNADDGIRSNYQLFQELLEKIR